MAKLTKCRLLSLNYGYIIGGDLYEVAHVGLSSAASAVSSLVRLVLLS
jgi:hypothetical protein